jgi:phosphate transport system permease protein
MFETIERDIEKMMNPRQVVYWQYFTDDSSVSHYLGGIGPEIVGTILLAVLCMAFAIPLGVTAAAYLTEFSREGPIMRGIRTCVNTLAGVPSIVFGLFGLAFFQIVVLPRFGMEPKASMLAGALTLSVLVLPVLIRASEEAIRAVPPTYKEAALSLGAGRLRAFVTVTLPAALPGILTGVILSLSRAAGETAPILFCCAVAYTSGFTVSPVGKVRTLTYGSYDLAQNDRLADLVPHMQFGMVMTLIGVVLLLNLVAIIIRSRIARKLRGQ